MRVDSSLDTKSRARQNSKQIRASPESSLGLREAASARPHRKPRSEVVRSVAFSPLHEALTKISQFRQIRESSPVQRLDAVSLPVTLVGRRGCRAPRQRTPNEGMTRRHQWGASSCGTASLLGAACAGGGRFQWSRRPVARPIGGLYTHSRCLIPFGDTLTRSWQSSGAIPSTACQTSTAAANQQGDGAAQLGRPGP